MTIKNDKDFRTALNNLSTEQQRALAAKFIQNVKHLCNDPLIDRTIAVADIAKQDNATVSEVFKQVKSLATATYTACGGDACWPEQAAHFVATAAKACLTPEDQIGAAMNLAWKTAIQARLANNCEMIEKDTGEISSEAQKQYLLTDEFLASL